MRAIQKGSTTGAHGLPLIGSGDWNDGMNHVGPEGRGESTWLGFFLHNVLTDFALVCDEIGDGARAARYRQDATALASRLDLAWDGEWFRRGYYDDGTPLGSASNDECQLDSIAQCWAVLSGAAPAPLAERAMDAVRAKLIARGPQLIRLLTPPFDRSAQDPGYIKSYPPGIRENGGQYTHAALWVVMAIAKLGSGDEAVELFHLLNPINHTRTPVAARDLQGRAVRRRGRHLRSARRTRGAPAGRGTRDRPAGCTAPGSRACSACGVAARRFRLTRAFRPAGRRTRSRAGSDPRSTKSTCSILIINAAVSDRRSWTARPLTPRGFRFSTTGAVTRSRLSWMDHRHEQRTSSVDLRPSSRIR